MSNDNALSQILLIVLVGMIIYINYGLCNHKN